MNWIMRKRLMWEMRRWGIRYTDLPEIQGEFPSFRNEGSFILGEKCFFRATRLKIAFAVLKGASLEIGRNVFINDGVTICSSQSVKIGDHVKIADMVTIYDTNFHQIEQHNSGTSKAVSIGRNVWLGAASIILPGADIGNHSIVAAGAVVSGSVPEKVIVGGVPARIIRDIICDDDWIRK